MSPPPFGQVRRLGVVGSTNAYLLGEARRGAPAGLVAVADHQTAGRGRLGRRWEAPPGSSLLLSVLLRPVLPAGDLHLCTAAVALATASACRTVAGVWPTVKWPNDLLVGDDKLAGVLAEADAAAPGGPPGSVAVVVGVGCNVDWPGPPDAGGTCLADAAGRPVDREPLLQALLTELGPRVEALGTDDGRRGLGDELRARCRTLGQVVRVDLVGAAEGGAGTGDGIVGRAVDLTAEGHLVVETGDGRQVVAAGDVVHLRPADGDRRGR
ncbi:MAG TPA: biotin--[acetyl-CoA-carboxylase] ligase [Acidimicrobiales bacterium]|jgi:BirA family biotin operon repressor/biotin-[acetyl-CoA-carboxylase] ligase|nr:biotin--[acetyl-CoA-carboxylase] ligase [Acidimicrobiales bacterium]